MSDEKWAVNSVIFKKPYDLEKATQEAKHFITSGTKKKPHETKTSYRFRNLNKNKFNQGSFKTKKINNNMSLVLGVLKTENNNLEGAGIMDFIKNPVKTIRNYLSPRKALNNTSTRTLKTYGNLIVQSLTIVRTPILNILDKAINLISLGKWKQLKKEYEFDKLYHLQLIANVGRKNIVLEKNEVINISTSYKNSSESETMQVPLNDKKFTMNEMIEKTEKIMGNDFTHYDGFKNNCQVFVKQLLNSEGLYGEREKNFLFQDVSEIAKKMPTMSKNIMNGLTDAGAIVNKISGGAGEENTLYKKDFEPYIKTDANLKGYNTYIDGKLLTADTEQQLLEIINKHPPIKNSYFNIFNFEYKQPEKIKFTTYEIMFRLYIHHKDGDIFKKKAANSKDSLIITFSQQDIKKYKITNKLLKEISSAVNNRIIEINQEQTIKYLLMVIEERKGDVVMNTTILNNLEPKEFKKINIKTSVTGPEKTKPPKHYMPELIKEKIEYLDDTPTPILKSKQTIPTYKFGKTKDKEKLIEPELEVEPIKTKELPIKTDTAYIFGKIKEVEPKREVEPKNPKPKKEKNIKPKKEKVIKPPKEKKPPRPYYRFDEPPKNYRRATMQEAIDKNKVFYYGTHIIDDEYTKHQIKEKSKFNYQKQIIGYQGLLRKLKRKIESLMKKKETDELKEQIKSNKIEYNNTVKAIDECLKLIQAL